MKALTETQLETLRKLEAVRDANMKRINDEIAKGTFSHVPNARASEWVSFATFFSVYPTVRLATFRALVKAGAILQRATDGHGPEVLVLRSASAAEIERLERDAEDAAREANQD